jgi:hypothetical protein
MINFATEITVTETSDEIASHHTLAAGPLPGGFVRVTQTEVSLWQDVRGEPVAKWKAGCEIVAAQVYGDYIVVGQRAGTVAVIKASQSALELVM